MLSKLYPVVGLVFLVGCAATVSNQDVREDVDAAAPYDPEPAAAEAPQGNKATEQDAGSPDKAPAAAVATDAGMSSHVDGGATDAGSHDASVPTSPTTPVPPTTPVTPPATTPVVTPPVTVPPVVTPVPPTMPVTPPVDPQPTPDPDPTPAVCMPDDCEGKPAASCFPQAKGPTWGGSNSGSFSKTLTLDSVSDVDIIQWQFTGRTVAPITITLTNSTPYSYLRFGCQESSPTGERTKCGAGTVANTYGECVITANTFTVSCPLNDAGWSAGSLEMGFAQPAVNGNPGPDSVCSYDVSLSWH